MATPNAAGVLSVERVRVDRAGSLQLVLGDSFLEALLLEPAGSAAMVRGWTLRSDPVLALDTPWTFLVQGPIQIFP